MGVGGKGRLEGVSRSAFLENSCVWFDWCWGCVSLLSVIGIKTMLKINLGWKRFIYLADSLVSHQRKPKQEPGGRNHGGLMVDASRVDCSPLVVCST